MRAASRDKPWVRVLWTGARVWDEEPEVIEPVLSAVMLGFLAGVPNMNRVTFIHGAARGLDRIVGQLSNFHGVQQEIHPVLSEDYARMGRRAPLERNDRMIAHGATLCLGVPAPGSDRDGGTWYTLRRAMEEDIPAFYLSHSPAFGWDFFPYTKAQQIPVIVQATLW